MLDVEEPLVEDARVAGVGEEGVPKRAAVRPRAGSSQPCVDTYNNGTRCMAGLRLEPLANCDGSETFPGAHLHDEARACPFEDGVQTASV